jgi:hypothetical protein
MTENRQGLPPASSFEDLEVFKRAYKASLAVHRRSLEFPSIEQRGLADQVRRASKSVCANIAEGFARQGAQPADFRRIWSWPWGRRTRCGCGAATAAISATSTRRPGRHGDRSIARSPGCCGACIAAGDRRASVICRLSSVLWTGSGAFRRPVKVGREAGWRYRKCTC